MRHAVPTTAKALNERYQGSLRDLAIELGLPPNTNATLSRILRGTPGVSLATENDLRDRLGLEPITRSACYRPYLPAAAGVLIRMEASRRGITPGALITQALGINDGETNR